jgi:hypothetical protein
VIRDWGAPFANSFKIRRAWDVSISSSTATALG